MSVIVGSVEFADRQAEQALCEFYGRFQVERAICDGQKGYRVTHPNGVRHFHFGLSTAIRDILSGLGHGEDREVIVIGEPEVGNAWMVRRT